MINLDLENSLNASYLVSLNEYSWICYKRLAHASMDLIGKLLRKDLVVDLLKLNYIKDRICDTCQKGKQVK